MALALVGKCFKTKLEDTTRYAGLLLDPAEGVGLWPRVFLPFKQKKNYHAFLANFRQFLFPVVTLVTLKRIQKVQKKKSKISKNQKKNGKTQKNPKNNPKIPPKKSENL